MRQKIPSVGWSYLELASGDRPPNHTSRIIQCRLALGPLPTLLLPSVITNNPGEICPV